MQNGGAGSTGAIRGLWHPAFEAPSFAEFFSSAEMLQFVKSWTGLEKEQLKVGLFFCMVRVCFSSLFFMFSCLFSFMDHVCSDVRSFSRSWQFSVPLIFCNPNRDADSEWNPGGGGWHRDGRWWCVISRCFPVSVS